MIIVFDTETTALPLHRNAALNLQPHIIELAAAALNPKTGEIFAEFSTLINPGIHIEDVITRITNLTDESVKDARPWKDALPSIQHFFKGATAVVAHNLPFDKGMVDFEMARIEKEFTWPVKQCCTVGMFRSFWGRNPKLIELYEWSTGGEYKQTHRALDDVRALVEVIQGEEAWKLM